MIYLFCASCKHGLRVSPGDQRGALSECEALLGAGSEYHPDKYPCPWCKERMSLLVAASPAALAVADVYDVTPQEAIAAIHGLGLPEERQCSAAAVEALLQGAQIKRVSAQQIRGSHRSIIDHIELEDGTKVYLASSAFGATIYRIAKSETPHG